MLVMKPGFLFLGPSCFAACGFFQRQDRFLKENPPGCAVLMGSVAGLITCKGTAVVQIWK